MLNNKSLKVNSDSAICLKKETDKSHSGQYDNSRDKYGLVYGYDVLCVWTPPCGVCQRARYETPPWHTTSHGSESQSTHLPLGAGPHWLSTAAASRGALTLPFTSRP